MEMQKSTIGATQTDTIARNALRIPTLVGSNLLERTLIKDGNAEIYNWRYSD
ncbi:hypothetical protein T06_9156 [Trichinella sp. T6]|nr:hypothetical protein T06_9156 [Trichinella sp. T6]